MKYITIGIFTFFSTIGFSDSLLHVGNLIDVDSGEVNKALTIRVSGNKIIEVTKGYASASKNDEIIERELGRKTPEQIRESVNKYLLN